MNKPGFRFEATGTVTRRFVRDKFAKITLSTPGIKGKTDRVECISFKPEEVRSVEDGAQVTIKGRVNLRQMRDAKQKWTDGSEHDVWENQLIVDAIMPAPGVPASAPAETPRKTQASAPQGHPGDSLEDDDLAF